MDIDLAPAPPASRPRSFRRLPRHIGIIPDGNRRWADEHDLPRRAGYAAGLAPGMQLLNRCRELGIEEASVYGFTKENVRRPSDQVTSFRAACVQFVQWAEREQVAIQVIGDVRSSAFPAELARYTVERTPGDFRVNLLVNYGWKWDLASAIERAASSGRDPTECLASSAASRIDLIVRWGARRRLSGFLPMQSAYADMFVIDTLWPDMTLEEFDRALDWFERQDVTLGG
jgi:undecaprenyl diphosphate synthase